MTGEYRLRFKSGEWFVTADDLHKTTWTLDHDAASVFATSTEALEMAQAMARTQGIRLYGTQA